MKHTFCSQTGLPNRCWLYSNTPRWLYSNTSLLSRAFFCRRALAAVLACDRRSFLGQRFDKAWPKDFPERPRRHEYSAAALAIAQQVPRLALAWVARPARRRNGDADVGDLRRWNRRRRRLSRGAIRSGRRGGHVACRRSSCGICSFCRGPCALLLLVVSHRRKRCAFLKLLLPRCAFSSCTIS